MGLWQSVLWVGCRCNNLHNLDLSFNAIICDDSNFVCTKAVLSERTKEATGLWVTRASSVNGQAQRMGKISAWTGGGMGKLSAWTEGGMGKLSAWAKSVYGQAQCMD